MTTLSWKLSRVPVALAVVTLVLLSPFSLTVYADEEVQASAPVEETVVEESPAPEEPAPVEESVPEAPPEPAEEPQAPTEPAPEEPQPPVEETPAVEEPAEESAPEPTVEGASTEEPAATEPTTTPALTDETSPTLSTDKDDYHPGETATIFGRFFAPVQSFLLKVFGSDENDQNYTETTTTVETDENGEFSFDYTLDSLYRPFYHLVASTLDGAILAESYFRDSSVGTYDQCSNDDGDGYATGDTGCRWTNGNIQANNSTYFEGDSTVQRLWIEGYAPGSSHTVTFKYGTTKGGSHAYDYLTTWDASESWVTVADRCQDITGCTTAAENTSAMKNDPNVTDTIEAAPASRFFTMRGGTITNVSVPALVSGTYAGDSETVVTVTFTVANSGSMCATKQNITSCGIALWFGAHVADSSQWTAFNGTTGAGNINGSPYHVALDAEDGASVGQRDNQMQSAAVVGGNEITTLTLIKTVTNDNGGDAQPTAWTLSANGPTPISGTSGSAAVTAAEVTPGAYTLSESGGPAGYTAGAWSCDGGTLQGDQLTLVEGDAVTCTINNNDVAPTLTLVKTVVNDNGGTATADSFQGKIDGNDVPWESAQSVSAGVHTASETTLDGYAAGSWGGDCAADGSVTLGLGENKTCTITNDDQPATLIVKKVVVNDNGGALGFVDFSFIANGSGHGFEPDGQNDLVVNAGTYTVTEPSVTGYATTYDNCTDVVIPNGGTATCTITNDDIAPSLTLVKEVVNDNGGTAEPAAWTLEASGPSGFSGAGPSVSNGASFDAGSYTLSESGGVAGYTASSWSCVKNNDAPVEGDSITLALGDTATCTIVNDDQSATLTVIKHVVNDNGGTAVAGDFTMHVTGTDVSTAAFPGVEDPGTTVTLDAGAYSVTEDGVTGYQGTGTADCAGTIANGETKTCTFTNDDIAPSLTLVKEVVNDHGGTAVATEWTLSADGPTSISGAGGATSDATFDAGTYALSETTGPAGYAAGSWSCVGGSQDGANITLGLGEVATCTIVNDDVQPKLTVTKVVVNDNGGQKVIADFPLFVNGNGVTSGVENGFNVGNYTVSETQSDGYTATISGDCAADGSVSLAVGDVKSCTITNDDQPGTLIVKKIVVNDNGGLLEADDFSFSVNGDSAQAFEGDGQNDLVVNAGTYTVTEPSVTGYATTYDNCTDVVIPNGGTATCTVTNDDVAPQLTVIKHVVNDNGGTAVAGDFTMNVTATAPSDDSFPGAEAPGTTITLNAGAYSVDEVELPGYTKTLGTDCAGTIAIGEQKTCTITNDDQQAFITVVKAVTNDNGGAALPDDFDLTLEGEAVTSGVAVPVDPGTYTAAETLLDGYAFAGYSGDCGENGDVTVALGESKTCTLTNNDIAPSLTLVKVVVTDNGGTAVATDWTLSAAGPTPISGAGGAASDATFNAGTYTLSESTGPSGYVASDWVCVGGTQDGASVTLGLGESATCTITNDDQPGHLIVHKVTDPASDTTTVFPITLSAAPTTGDANQSITGGASVDYTVDAGSYDVTEGAVAGWDMTGNDCEDVAVANGETKECTITNTKRGHLIVDKVTLPSGDSTSFSITASGTGTITGGGAGSVTDAENKDYEVTPGTYSVAETVPDGWDKTGDTCQDVVVAPGETETCTITNTKRSTLTIVKDAQPNDLIDFNFTGTAPLGSFSLDDDAGIAEADDTLLNSKTFTSLVPGSYAVAETLPNSFWKMKSVSCVVTGTSDSYPVNVSVSGMTVDLTPGVDVTCTFVNEKLLPTRTQGFWQTHTNFTSSVFTSNFLPGGMVIGTAPHKGAITTTGQLFGAYYSNIAKKTDNKQRTAIDKARMQLLQQLVTAKLNRAQFGSNPTIDGWIAAADAAYAGSNAAAILASAAQLDAYNNSGDSLIISGTPGKATPKESQSIADKVFWNAP